MPLTQWLLLLFSLAELALLIVVLIFFWRLRRSEETLSALQQKQEELLGKLQFNTQLEQELMASFAQRQKELVGLDRELADRADQLRKLVQKAEELRRSPQFLRDTILAGARGGESAVSLAKATGLSLDEVELILMENKASR